MGYETGTATDVNDLLDKLRLFAIAEGWSVNEFIDATNSGKILAINKGGVFFQFQSDRVTNTSADPKDRIHVWNSTAYSNGVALSSQTNAQQGMWTTALVGPFVAYHFFAGASPDYLHIVVEVSANLFRHLHVGTLDKAFSFTGGQYLMGHRMDRTLISSQTRAQDASESNHQLPWECGSGASPSGAGQNKFRADIDAASNKWFETRFSAADGSRGKGVFRSPAGFSNVEPVIWEFPLRCSPSNFNGRAPLFPIYALAQREGGFCPLGVVKDVRMVNNRNILPGDTITIGSDDWMVFPIAMKYPSTNPGALASGDVGSFTENSWVWAYAYKVP